jgi:hypothetical protein
MYQSANRGGGSPQSLLLSIVVVVRPRIYSPTAEAINDPDLNKNVSQIIVERGYPCEEHVVQTEDGYLLSVQRINLRPGLADH